MHIIVCFKEVPDPDGIYQLDEAGNIRTDLLAPVPGVFDENALEEAVQIKENHGGEVTVLCFGPATADKTLLNAIAMGADRAILIENPTGIQLDSYGTAAILSEAVKKVGTFDIIICGRESSDLGAGLVGPLLAQSLGIPFITLVTALEIEGESLLVHRLADGGGVDVYRGRLPFLLTVSNQINYPRFPSVIALLKAKRGKGVERWALGDLGVDVDAVTGEGKRFVTRRRYLPQAGGSCQFIEGENSEDKASNLVEVMLQERLI